MLIPHCDYPVRPRRKRWESLVGYVSRFYWENGRDVPEALHDMVRELYICHKPNDALDRLVATLGKWGRADRDWWVSRRLDPHVPTGRLPKWRQLQYGSIRFCPACLRESGFHAVLWTLPLVEACPRHHCELLSTCTACDRPLSWTTLRPGWRCRCWKELSAMPSHPAPLWAVRIASTVAGSAELRRQSRDDCNLLVPVPNVPRYSLYDAYDFLEPAGGFQSTLARKVRFLYSSHAVLVAAFRRILRLNFRNQQTILVWLRDDAPLALAIKHLNRVPRNRLTEPLRREAGRLLGALHAGIEYDETVYFHPRFLEIDRRPYLAKFARWWHKLANRVSVLEPEAQLRFGRAVFFRSGNQPSSVEILNILLNAAWRRVPIDRYSILAARWHIPKELQRRLRPDEIVKELGSYLMRRPGSELAFVIDLLIDGEERAKWP